VPLAALLLLLELGDRVCGVGGYEVGGERAQLALGHVLAVPGEHPAAGLLVEAVAEIRIVNRNCGSMNRSRFPTMLFPRSSRRRRTSSTYDFIGTTRPAGRRAREGGDDGALRSFGIPRWRRSSIP